MHLKGISISLKWQSILSAFLLSIGFLNAQISTDSLILHYDYNGDATDQTTNSFDGVINGASLTTDRDGNPNMAYDFNGTTDYISLPYDSLLQPDFPFSVSFWFKADSIPAPSTLGTYLFASDEEQDVYSGFFIMFNTLGQITMHYGNGLGIGGTHRRTKKSITVLDTVNWHHVAAVFNGLNDMELYIDCELDEGVYSGSGSSMFNYGNAGKIGNSIGGQILNYFDGKMDDLYFYSRSLNLNDISQLCTEITLCEVDTSISISGDTLITNLAGAEYQWLDCKENYASLEGDTFQNFTPPNTDYYAVEISYNGCIDTSACVRIDRLDLSEIEILDQIELVTDPNSNLVNLHLIESMEFNLEVYNLLGEKVYQKNDIKDNYFSFYFNEGTGVYFLRAFNKDLNKTIKFILK